MTVNDVVTSHSISDHTNRYGNVYDPDLALFVINTELFGTISNCDILNLILEMRILMQKQDAPLTCNL